MLLSIGALLGLFYGAEAVITRTVNKLKPVTAKDTIAFLRKKGYEVGVLNKAYDDEGKVKCDDKGRVKEEWFEIGRDRYRYYFHICRQSNLTYCYLYARMIFEDPDGYGRIADKIMSRRFVRFQTTEVEGKPVLLLSVEFYSDSMGYLSRHLPVFIDSINATIHEISDLYKEVNEIEKTVENTAPKNSSDKSTLVN